MQALPAGKKVGPNTYYHVDVLPVINPLQRSKILTAIEIAGIPQGDGFNVIKLSQTAESITLLNYPRFFEEAFPVLANYWTVDLPNQTCRYKTYADSLNPPILQAPTILPKTP